MKNEMWLIWKDSKNRQRHKIGLLVEDNNEFRFNYLTKELKEAQKVGFDFFPGFESLDKEYISDKLFINIATRLPNPNRPDYLEILNIYNLSANATVMEILKATRGRLVTDSYEFVPVFDKNKVEFDIAGTRHREDIEKCKKFLKIDDLLYLELEPENKQDSNAIKVIYKHDNNNYHIGYVPRYYSAELTNLLQKNINYSAMIQKLNFETEIIDEEITASVKLIFNN